MAGTVFSQAPFVALIVGAIASAIVCRRLASHPDARVRARSSAARCLLCIALAAVGAEHLLLLLAPQAVLRWNADVRRLIALEAVGAAAGCACAVAALVALWRQLLSDRGDTRSVARTLNLSVASVVMVSGVTIAIAYRWASSWSVVTLTPYVLSLSSMHPRDELVTATPFVVRLHVLGAFASIALLPLGDTFAAFVVRVRRSVGAIAARLSHPRLAHPHLKVAAAGAVRSKAVWSEEDH